MLLWFLVATYAVSRVLQIFPSRVPLLAVVALHVFPSAIFALIHGAIFYRVRGILIFIALCLVVGNICENIGIVTGVPFGTYYFTDVMGPKLFRVPILLGLAYVGMGYLAWTLSRIILGTTRNALSGANLFTVPFFSAFLMVSWDLSMDPIWSTVVHAWIWGNGGGYFGVPITNFLGWFVVVYVIYQLFALCLRNRQQTAVPLRSSYWHLAIAFYGISAAGNLLLAIPVPGPLVVFDPAGAVWRVSDITATCALVSLFTMGSYTLLAIARLHTESASA